MDSTWKSSYTAVQMMEKGKYEEGKILKKLCNG